MLQQVARQSKLTSMSVNGLPVSLLVAWINKSRKLPGLHPDRMLTSCLALAVPLAVPLAEPFAVPFIAASRARVSSMSWVSSPRNLCRACKVSSRHITTLHTDENLEPMPTADKPLVLMRKALLQHHARHDAMVPTLACECGSASACRRSHSV